MTKWIKVLAVLCMWMALPTGCLAQEYYRVSDVYKQVQEKWKAEYKDSQGRVIPVNVLSHGLSNTRHHRAVLRRWLKNFASCG